MLARPTVATSTTRSRVDLPRAIYLCEATSPPQFGAGCDGGLIYVRLTLPCMIRRRAMRARDARSRGTVGMEFLVILVGFIALFVALNARKGVASLQLQLNGLLARFSRLEDELEDLRRDARRPRAPVAPVPKRRLRECRRCSRGAAGGRDAPTGASRPAVACLRCRRLLHQLAPAAASATLEERLGTRWAVWVGGLALALGGLLLVRYLDRAGHLRTRRARGARRPLLARAHCASANGSAAPSAVCRWRRSPPRTCRAS